MTSRSRGIAKVGAIASFACAIHCAALPILIGAGAAGSLSFLRNEPFEWGMVLLAASVGTFAAWRGFRTHGNLAVVTVLLTATAGLVALTLHHGSGAHELEQADTPHGIAWLSALAGVALGVSLLVNSRMCKTCHDCRHA